MLSQAVSVEVTGTAPAFVPLSALASPRSLTGCSTGFKLEIDKRSHDQETRETSLNLVAKLYQLRSETHVIYYTHTPYKIGNVFFSPTFYFALFIDPVRLIT